MKFKFKRIKIIPRGLARGVCGGLFARRFFMTARAKTGKVFALCY